VSSCEVVSSVANDVVN